MRVFLLLLVPPNTDRMVYAAHVHILCVGIGIGVTAYILLLLVWITLHFAVFLMENK